MNNPRLLGLLCISIFLSNILIAQKTISCKVIDIKKNIPVQDVSVQITNSKKGTYTNENGIFSLENVTSKTLITLSKIGYITFNISINQIDGIIYLEPKINELQEVVLRTFSSSQLKKVAPDQIYFSQNDIKKMPFILGEKDVIKLIQYTPGVQQSTEGQSGILVRGGNESMNLTLLDNVYLHNTAHLGGVFSAINSDFVETLEFSKAGFDASYGGRLASVTDIRTLRPSDTTYFKGSIGLLSAKLTGNINLNKKNNLVVSGRRTYLEVFRPFFKDENSIVSKKKNYFLYDFLTKHNLKLSKNDNLETIFYLTRDNFRDQTKGRNRQLNWGNFLLGTTYKHQFSPSLSSQSTISNSFYEFKFSDNEFPFDYNANSTFNLFSINHYFLWDKPAYLFKAGIAYNKNKIQPKKVEATIDNSPIEILNQETFNYDDISIFGDFEFNISSTLKAKTGLRLTTFLTQPNALIKRKKYFAFEPRISMKYEFSENQVFKLSYQRLSQFIHQASVSSFSLPADFFIISTEAIKPQISNQFSLGSSYEENGLQLNSSIYFKNVSNYTEFENGSVNNLFSNNIYEDILVGKFNSYGFELSVNKKINRLTAQGALTLSKTIAKFNEINNGNYFAATFDRPININTILNYKLNTRFEFGALFLFSSGQNYTKPRDIRIINEKPILNFEPKNASRFPNYHRLDLSCTYAFKQKGKWNSKINLTLYNIYNNNNPFQISFETEGNVDDSFIEITESRNNLFPFLPTINWLFAF